MQLQRTFKKKEDRCPIHVCQSKPKPEKILESRAERQSPTSKKKCCMASAEKGGAPTSDPDAPAPPGTAFGCRCPEGPPQCRWWRSAPPACRSLRWGGPPCRWCRWARQAGRWSHWPRLPGTRGCWLSHWRGARSRGGASTHISAGGGNEAQRKKNVNSKFETEIKNAYVDPFEPIPGPNGSQAQPLPSEAVRKQLCGPIASGPNVTSTFL